MDYWNYLAHSQGSERAGHRYYARELVGNKGGRNQYRYFYTAQEYAAYRKGVGTNPGRNTYAENGTSRNGVILNRTNPNRDAEITSRGNLHRSRVTEARAERVKADAEAYRTKRQAEQARKDAAASRGEKHSNRVTSAIAERVKKEAADYRRKRRGEKHAKRVAQARAERVRSDAKAYRRSRQDSANAKRIAEQHSLDRKRWETEARAAQVKKDAQAYRRKQAAANRKREKIKMDAKRYRSKKRAAAKQGRDFAKRVMDNTRVRKSYQPKKV